VKHLLRLPLIARVCAVISLVFLGLFVFGGELHLGDMSARQWLLFACFPLGVAAGLLYGVLRSARTGGLVALASIAAFYGVHVAGDGAWPKGPYFLLIASPGLLLVMASFAPRSR